ncbi:lysosomal proton-coupled steroid conjugate and bile acid symporter SLC46A3-like [Haliotis cracherodii]|uniref:lysosomal proton-coupled steroid conjugate and bile acid symporter SLC46A3-like n=1 Tax=Haliotis cracherodii TaxID=6455 RepID=UPI0039E85D8D
MEDDNIHCGRETEPLIKDGGDHIVPGSQKTIQIRRLFLVSLILFLHGGSGAIHSPLMSQYLYLRYSEEYFPNSTFPERKTSHSECVANSTAMESDLQKEVQKEATNLNMQLTLATSIPAIFTNLFLGAYSDYFGRRFLFMTMMVGRLTRDLTTVAIIVWNLDLHYFFIGYGADGLCGSSFTFYLAGYAYTADITPPAKVRTVALAVVDAARGIADISLHIATGYLIKMYGYLYPSVGMAAMTLLDFLVVVTLLRETVKRSGTCISPITAIKNVFGFYFRKTSTGNRVLFWICISVFLFKMIDMHGTVNIENLYMLSPPFCWDSVRLGLYGALKDGVYYFSSVVIIKALHVCTTDGVVGIIGFMSAAASKLIEGLAFVDWMLYLVPVVGVASSAISPALRAILSRMVPAEEQGAIFTSMSVVEAVCDAVGSTALNVVYEATLSVMRGAAFLIMAATKIVAIVLLTVFVFKTRSRVVPPKDNLCVQGRDDQDISDEEQQ